MRFLLDENADARLVPFLVSLGHDVTAIVRDYPQSLPDDKVLRIALREARILITNDRDFGELVVRAGLAHAGVILLRLSTTDFTSLTARLSAVLHEYPDQHDFSSW